MRISDDMMEYLEQSAAIDAGIDAQVALDECIKWDREEARILAENKDLARLLIRRMYATGDTLGLHLAGKLYGNNTILLDRNESEDKNHVFARGKVKSACGEVEAGL